MSDTPATNVTPAQTGNTPVASGNTNDTSTKSNVAPKVDASAVKAAANAATAPVDKVAADKVKVDNAAEKAVIQKIKLGDVEYDPAVLQSMIDKSNGADKKFLEAAKMRKEAMRFFKLAKENPKEFLAKTGMDPKKFAYDEVAQDIKNKLRDPKEVALEEAEKRIKAYEAKEAEQKRLADEAKLEQQAKSLEQKFHAEMIDALEAYPELPKNGFTVAKLAEAIETVRQKTGILLTAKEVAPKVVSDMRRQVEGVVKGLTPEQLISLIGQESVDAILKHSLSKVKNPLAGSNGAQGSTESKPKEKRWKSSNDFWKTIDKAAKQERGE